MSAEPSSEPVRLHLGEDRVATIRLNRPEVRNAFDGPAWQALAEAAATVRAQDVRAVVLTGGEEFFSAGGDVRSMPGPDGRLTAPADRLATAHQALRALAGLDAVVIAAVEGYAIGVAWGVVLGCDLVVAGRSAYFQASFPLRGLVADGGTAWHLPRALGHQRAMRHLLLAEPLLATDAHQAGMVSHLVDDHTALPVAHDLAARLASGPHESNALTRSLARRGASSDWDSFLEAERVAVALAGHGGNAVEGRTAFVEKRKPDFR